MTRSIISLAAAVLLGSLPLAAAADVNAGAALVASHGCEGCHGAQLKGTAAFPSLYGIEHRLTRVQIITALLQPKAPMPNFGFTSAQATDIAEYLASLDGGSSGTTPTIELSKGASSDTETVTVRFPGAAPKRVTATATMSMGGMAMTASAVTLKPVGDGHTFTGQLTFSMGGAWTVHVTYDGKHLDKPVSIGE